MVSRKSRKSRRSKVSNFPEFNLDLAEVPLMSGHTTSEILFEVCAKLSMNAITKILEEFQVTTEDVIRYKLFEKVCSRGNLEVAKFLVSFYGIRSKYIKNMEKLYISSIIKGGHFKVIKWLDEEYNILSDYNLSITRSGLSRLTEQAARSGNTDEFEGCCSNGPLEMVKWYVKTFGITQENFYKYNHLSSLLAACSAGKKSTAEWLVKKFKIDKSNTPGKRHFLINICQSKEDRLEFIMWYVNKFNLTRKNIEKDNVVLSIITCCDYGHLESAIWLTRRFEIDNKDIIEDKDLYKSPIINACSKGNINILKWIFTTFNLLILEDEDLIISCFKENLIQGNIESAKWLLGTQSNLRDIRRIVPDPVDAVGKIIMNSESLVSTLKWFQKQYNCSFKKFDNKNQAEILKHIFGTLELKGIKWFVEGFNIKKSEIVLTTYKGYFIPLVQACRRESLKLAKWVTVYFELNKGNILRNLEAYSSSKNILIYLKTKYNITKEDIRINNILEKLLVGADYYQDSLIIVIDVFNVSRRGLMEAINLNYKNKIYADINLRQLLFFKYGILAPLAHHNSG